jgi:outer membrane protein assembly factor BamB
MTTGVDYSTPVFYDYEGKRYAILGSYEGLHSVETKTGKVLWLYPWDKYSGNYIPDPLIFDGKVFSTDAYGQSVLLDIAGGEAKVLWKNKNLLGEIDDPVMIDGYVYGTHGGPEAWAAAFRCLSAETGEPMWDKYFMHENAISATAADGKLLILEESGTLRIAEATPTSYKEISSCDVLGGAQTLKRMLKNIL